LHYVAPRTRTEFWGAKLRTNVERDRRQTIELETLGWRVMRLWEHEVFEDLQWGINRVKAALAGRELAQASPEWRVVSVEHCDSNLERRRLELLRDHQQCREELRERTTRKWKRERSSI
jgi:DNA mismatch endonuclease (patch repair protein)